MEKENHRQASRKSRDAPQQPVMHVYHGRRAGQAVVRVSPFAPHAAPPTSSMAVASATHAHASDARGAAASNGTAAPTVTGACSGSVGEMDSDAVVDARSSSKTTAVAATAIPTAVRADAVDSGASSTGGRNVNGGGGDSGGGGGGGGGGGPKSSAVPPWRRGKGRRGRALKKKKKKPWLRPPPKIVRGKSRSRPDDATSDAASAASAAAATPVDAEVQVLGQKWGELMFLLRKPVASPTDVETTVATAREGLAFLDKLEALAEELGVLRGSLSRWLLPYDSETPTLDQAAGAARAMAAMGAGATAGSSTAAQLRAGGVEARLFEERISHETRTHMVQSAVGLRGLVRVKIADDADLGQARAAIGTVLHFFDGLHAASSKRGVAPFDLLKTL